MTRIGAPRPHPAPPVSSTTQGSRPSLPAPLVPAVPLPAAQVGTAGNCQSLCARRSMSTYYFLSQSCAPPEDWGQLSGRTRWRVSPWSSGTRIVARERLPKEVSDSGGAAGHRPSRDDTAGQTAGAGADGLGAWEHDRGARGVRNRGSGWSERRSTAARLGLLVLTQLETKDQTTSNAIIATRSVKDLAAERFSHCEGGPAVAQVDLMTFNSSQVAQAFRFAGT